MTEEEKLAITRLAVFVMRHDDKYNRKFYESDGKDVKYNSTDDAKTALSYLINKGY